MAAACASRVSSHSESIYTAITPQPTLSPCMVIMAPFQITVIWNVLPGTGRNQSPTPQRRLFETGLLLVDSCADDCDEVTNLVEAPGKCIAKAAAADERARTGGEATRTGLSEDARGSAFWTHRGVKYLERYAYLLLFAAYVELNASSGFQRAFSEWMRRHWAFKRTIKDLALR